MVTVGDRLRNARERKNLTQIDVARQTGINNKTISNYENNISSPDPQTLKVFAEVYETTADYLIGRIKTPSIKDSSFDSDVHQIDLSGLPDEAIKQVEEYVELIRLKYDTRRTSKKK